jgi:hypothetical protein
VSYRFSETMLLRSEVFASSLFYRSSHRFGFEASFECGTKPDRAYTTPLTLLKSKEYKSGRNMETFLGDTNHDHIVNVFVLLKY